MTRKYDEALRLIWITKEVWLSKKILDKCVDPDCR
jgi:hypothetical protein